MRKRRIKKELISDSSHQKCELHIKSLENSSLHHSKSYADVAREGKSTSLGNLNIRDIYLDLMNDESNNSSSIEITPPRLSSNSAEMLNSSNSLENSTPQSLGLTSQDRELVSILDELQNVSVTGPSNNTDSTRLTGYFCSETVFNLSNRVLSDAEIKVLEKGLDYAPIQNKINEPELRNDFNEFCRRMRLKWYFRNEVTPNFSEVPAFRPKSSWNPPKGHPNLEVFLSEVEKELFTVVDSKLGYSNLSKEEWKAMRTLADDRTIVIKKADKGSFVVVWGCNDYIEEAEKQLNDTSVYRMSALTRNSCKN